jgi:hypothetical protein
LKVLNSAMDNRRVTVSISLIVLICFFLPWIQVSCGHSEDRLSGIDLARDNHHALWLIPVLMVTVLILSLAKNWKEKRESARRQYFRTHRREPDRLVLAWIWIDNHACGCFCRAVAKTPNASRIITLSFDVVSCGFVDHDFLGTHDPRIHTNSHK